MPYLIHYLSESSAWVFGIARERNPEEEEEVQGKKEIKSISSLIDRGHWAVEWRYPVFLLGGFEQL
jgi:hypothetical protein